MIPLPSDVDVDKVDAAVKIVQALHPTTAEVGMTISTGDPMPKRIDLLDDEERALYRLAIQFLTKVMS